MQKLSWKCTENVLELWNKHVSFINYDSVIHHNFVDNFGSITHAKRREYVRQ